MKSFQPPLEQRSLLQAAAGSLVTGEWAVLKADGFLSADHSWCEQRIDLLTVVVLGHNLGGWRRGLGKTAWRAHSSSRPSPGAGICGRPGPRAGAIIGDEGR